MKKYLAPEVNELTFGANENIANDIPESGPSNLFNDAEFGQW